MNHQILFWFKLKQGVLTISIQYSLFLIKFHIKSFKNSNIYNFSNAIESFNLELDTDWNCFVEHVLISRKINIRTSLYGPNNATVIVSPSIGVGQASLRENANSTWLYTIQITWETALFQLHQ